MYCLLLSMSLLHVGHQSSVLSHLEVTELALERVVNTLVIVQYRGRTKPLAALNTYEIFLFGVSYFMLLELTAVLEFLFANTTNVFSMF